MRYPIISRNNLIVFTISIFAIVSIPRFLLGANRYIRQGATGNNSGSDWNNAFIGFPNTMVRGDTYYIADGSYGSYNFNDPNSGAQYITIKKATVSDHGTDTGWVNAYGDGQALFKSLSINSDYWIIDGNVRNSDWKSGYGFKVTGLNAGEKGIRIDANYVTIRYLEIEHRGRNYDTSDDGIYGFGATNVTIQNCYFHDFSRVPFLTRGWNTMLIEYSYIARNSSSAAQHSEMWSDDGSDNITFRYNIVEDIEGTAVFAQLNNNNVIADNWQIYGNVFFWSSNYGTPPNNEGISGLIYVAWDSVQKITATNWKIYNNTIVRCPGLWSGFVFLSSETTALAYNNMWYDCVRTNHTNVQISHSWYYNTARDGDNSSVEIGMGDPFIDKAGNNFRLLLATVSGKNDLGVQYNKDMDGNLRGADGIWDRGAYEYNRDTVPVKPPAAPSNLRIQ